MQSPTPSLLVTYSRYLVVKYVNVAAAAFILCEGFANLTREIDLVWRAKWSATKVLYLLARYLPYMQALPSAYLCLQHELSYSQCRATVWVGWIGVFTGTVVFGTILQQRLHAIYNQALWVKIMTMTAFVVTSVSVPVIAGLHRGGEIRSVPGLALCIAKVPKSFYALWIPPMAFDLLMVVLVCLKATQHFRTSCDSSARGYRLMKVIARDSVSYFLCGLVLYLFNMSILLLSPSDYAQLGTLWALCINSAVITRMMLNLREEYETPQNSVQFPYTQETMHFYYIQGSPWSHSVRRSSSTVA